MLDIKVIGTGCDKCGKLYEHTQSALKELGIEANLQKVEDLLEIVKLGVMTSPSLMVNGKLIVSGQVVSKDKIVKLLSQYK